MLSVLFALLLAVTTVTAKCGPLPLSLGRTWKMVVYGATNCSKSHYYEEFYGTLTTTGCYKIKITHNRLNEVKSFVFMGSDELRVNLHDTALANLSRKPTTPIFRHPIGT
ncbi:hypothetical protein BV22DRAFT_1128680 [Leucogyrophana mollusca]|uniref:Uncharacterized protein n=1 Tax=Leucogyrophana mollusca TaxID=85980 RepID=A0ACB8BLT0_9AGAM|nr:hypothetical protein BV22DRAFT_1128680 [Leucogyrophana mollusca]